MKSFVRETLEPFKPLTMKAKKRKASNIKIEDIHDLWLNMYGISTFKAFMVGDSNKIKKLKFTLFFITNRVFILHYMIANVISLFVVKDENEGNKYLNTVLWLQVTQAWFKSFYFVYYRKDLSLFQFRHEEFLSTRYRQEYAEKILTGKYKLLKKMQTFFYSGCFLNIGFWCLDPFLRATFHVLPSNYHMVTITNPYIKVAVAIYEAYLVFFLITHFTVVILYFLFAINMYVGQMKILNECLIDRTEETPFKLISEDSEEITGPIKNPKPIAVGDYISDHQKLIKYHSILANVLGPILLVTFICVLFEMCLLTILTQKPADATPDPVDQYVKTFKYATFWLTCCGEIFLFSWICSKLIENRESTHFALYQSNWYKNDPKYRKIILLSMTTLWPTNPITALGFADIELGTFIAVVRMSYTFYTFLRETEGK